MTECINVLMVEWKEDCKVTHDPKTGSLRVETRNQILKKKKIRHLMAGPEGRSQPISASDMKGVVDTCTSLYDT